MAHKLSGVVGVCRKIGCRQNLATFDVNTQVSSKITCVPKCLSYLLTLEPRGYISYMRYISNCLCQILVDKNSFCAFPRLFFHRALGVQQHQDLHDARGAAAARGMEAAGAIMVLGGLVHSPCFQRGGSKNNRTIQTYNIAISKKMVVLYFLSFSFVFCSSFLVK